MQKINNLAEASGFLKKGQVEKYLTRRKIYANTSLSVNDPKRFPRLEDAYPSLFERKEQQDWWVMKERIERFARAKKMEQV